MSEEVYWVRHNASGALEKVGAARLEELGDTVTEEDPPMVAMGFGGARIEERDGEFYILDGGVEHGPYKTEQGAEQAARRRGLMQTAEELNESADQG